MFNIIKKIFFTGKKYLFSLVLLSVLMNISLSLKSQDDFYNMEQVCQIKIEFYDANWKLILDSLFSAGDKTTRIKADVEIDGIVYKECGIRYKGFSSWNSDEAKNPFSINLDYTYKNQNHLGYKKLKLSNVIYDPSFVREVISYSIARKYMPAPEANYANLFINDTLIGLYTNVEAVDECFVEKHFTRNNNPFFKGNPENLVYPFGQNANLNYFAGDSSAYFPYYSLESDYGWEKLAEFIYVLNKDTARISQVLNVDRALWMHAFNYALLNLDSYIAYAQNYYIILDDNGLFNTVPWDLNMSFGSFRHSDGATNFSGVSMEKLPELNPLQHLTFSISPRPLMKNLFLNSTYRKMYLAHLRTIMNENLTNGEYLETGEQLQDLINNYVANDTNKFYTVESFHENLYSEVGVSTELFPGLRDITALRLEYLENFTGIFGYPVILGSGISPEIAIKGEPVEISLNVADADKVLLYYRCYMNDIFTPIIMTDDGNGADLFADDSVYSVSLIPDGKILQYYFWTENDSAGAFLPERAAGVYYNCPIRTEPGDLIINEIIYNNHDFADLATFSDIDKIELYNNTASDFELKNLVLEIEGGNYIINDTTIDNNGFLLLNCHNLSQMDGGDILSFNGSVVLKFEDNYFIDSIKPVYCVQDRSVGIFPEGSYSESVLIPTPEANNRLAGDRIDIVNIYPNPSVQSVVCECNTNDEMNFIDVFDAYGREVYNMIVNNDHFISETIDIQTWSSGIYTIRISGNNDCIFGRLIKL